MGAHGRQRPATDLGPRHALTRLEELHRTLTNKLFREIPRWEKNTGAHNAVWMWEEKNSGADYCARSVWKKNSDAQYFLEPRAGKIVKK